MIERLGWVVWLAVATASAAVPAPAAPAPAAASAGAARASAAEAAYQDALTRYGAGLAPLDEVYLWSVRWTEAARDAGDAGAWPAQVARMKVLADQVHTRVQTGTAAPLDDLAMTYYVADAEYHVSH
jgi:hypothetical protein